jgi:hypothetical protein
MRLLRDPRRPSLVSTELPITQRKVTEGPYRRPCLPRKRRNSGCSPRSRPPRSSRTCRKCLGRACRSATAPPACIPYRRRRAPQLCRPCHHRHPYPCSRPCHRHLNLRCRPSPKPGNRTPLKRRRPGYRTAPGRPGSCDPSLCNLPQPRRSQRTIQSTQAPTTHREATRLPEFD